MLFLIGSFSGFKGIPCKLLSLIQRMVPLPGITTSSSLIHDFPNTKNVRDLSDLFYRCIMDPAVVVASLGCTLDSAADLIYLNSP